MPQQFSTADPETVIEAVEEQPHTYDTTKVGPGLMVIYRSDKSDFVRGYDGLTQKFGWYVAMYEPDPENGDTAILMPITEVLE